MIIEHQNMKNKSITAAVLGLPNAGKSTLINALLGYDLSIVSSRPQTTRNHFQCVMNVDETEIILIDSPGVHNSTQELNIRMNGQAKFATEGADVNFIVVDSSKDVLSGLDHFLKIIDYQYGPAWLVLTKSDQSTFSEEVLSELKSTIKEKYDFIEEIFYTSAKEEENLHEIVGSLCDRAKPSPHFYPRGDVSNKNMRFFVTEYIREQVFHQLKAELPYEIAVTIDEYRDGYQTEDGKKYAALISATIHVNRPSQRAIVVGAKGTQIKKIGQEARAKIEAMIGSKAFLNLHVKVSPRWFKKNHLLEELGLPRTQESHRVWRAR